MVAALDGMVLLLGCAPSGAPVTLAGDDVVSVSTAGALVTTSGWSAEGNQTGAELGRALGRAGDVNGDGFADVIVGAAALDNGATDVGEARVYHGTATGLALAPAWRIESGQALAHLGTSVAAAGDVDGDGFADVIVGAPDFDNGEGGEGRVYVYHGGATGLQATAAWTAENNLGSSGLGQSVASAGDVDGDGYGDVLIGAINYDFGHGSEGAAYVYHGSSTGLAAAFAWRYESNVPNAQLGNQVAGAGDVNGDGYADIVVGAWGYSNGQTTEGRAYVFHGSSTGIAATPAWTTESNQASAYFGNAVSGAGDVNGDGYADIVVGAYWHTNGQSSEGGIFGYHGSATGLGAASAWTVESNEASSGYGISVGDAGDVNSDGYADVVVGAHHATNGETTEGRVLVYHGGPGGLVAAPVWTFESNQPSAQLGWSVAGAGDVNGDGFADLLAAAGGYDNGQSEEGRVWAFHGTAAPPAASASWTAEGNQDGARLGWGAGAAGDVNGDGWDDLVAAAPNHSNGQSGEGRGYCYHGSVTGLAPAAAWTAESDQASAAYGITIVTAGDVNADGFADVIAAATSYDNGQTDEGLALVYHGSATGLTAVASWTTELDQASAFMGDTLASAGDVNGDGYADVIVGTWGYDNGEAEEGRTYVFHGSATGVSTVPAWIAESNQVGANLGLAAAGAGDVNGDGFADVVAGAYLYDNGQSDEGRAYVHHGSVTGLAVAAAWTAEGNQAGARLGCSVDAAGDVDGDGFGDVVVGACEFDNGQTDEGRVFVYHGSSTGLAAAAAWSVESNNAGAKLGDAVAAAGDLNGDSYADVVVAAPFYTNDQSQEGRVYAYYGSATGLAAAAAWTVESNQGNGWYGHHLGTAGDVNGDGFADVFVSAFSAGNDQASEGIVYVYHGNNGAARPGLYALQRDAADARLLAHGEKTSTGVTLRLVTRSTIGLSRAKLQWELKPADQPFDGSGLAASGAFQSTTLAVSTYTGLVTPAVGRYHWRARLLYQPSKTTAVASRWFYPSQPDVGPDFVVVGNSAPVLAAATVTGSVAEGSASASFSVQITATDPDPGSTLVYRVDCDGDGIHGEAGEPVESHAPGTHTLTCTAVNASSWSGDATRSIGIRLSDGAATTTSTSYSVSVANIAPSIDGIDHVPTVSEGGSVGLTVVASDVDTLTYDFDCDGDGLFDGVDDLVGTASATFTCPVGDDGASTLNVRVHDEETFTSGSSSVTVLNVAPVVSPSIGTGPYSVLDVITCVAGYSDIAADTPAASVTYDWLVNGSAIGHDQSTLTGASFIGGDTIACTVSATDGDGGSSGIVQSNTLTTDPDCDSDGLSDAWEATFLGGDPHTCSLPATAAGDGDGDGRSNLQEETDGSDPMASNAPPAPVVLAPTDGAVVGAPQPTLTVTNALDAPPSDTFVYEFELYSDAGLAVLVDSITALPEGGSSTAWSLTAVTLTEDEQYWWRARAHDGYAAGAWSTAASFTVSTANGAPTINSVVALSGIDEASPSASFTVEIDAADAEGDVLTYRVDCDNDGTYLESGEPQQTASAGALQLGCSGVDASLDAGPGSHTIGVQVTDGTTLVSSAGSVAVANVLPTLTLANNGPVGEDATAVTVIATAMDVIDSLVYDYDCDNDGTYELTDAGSSTSCPLAGLDDGTRTVAARVSDGAGSTTASTTLMVTNVLPTLAPSLGAGPFTVLSTLTCSPGYVDVPGDTPATALSYDWVVNATSLGLDESTLSSGSFSGGDAVQCVVTASDDDGGSAGPTASAVVTISTDCDGDGLTDTWEELHLGGSAQTCTLPSEPSDDLDGDGRTNLEEQAGGSDPAVSDVPPAPVLLGPIDDVDVYTATPALTLANVVDAPPDDALTYDFEVYSDAALAQLVDSTTGVAEGVSTTSWTLTVALASGVDVWWRARADDGVLPGPWSAAAHFVVVSAHPSAPLIVSVPPVTFLVGAPYTYAAVATGAQPLAWSLDVAPAGMSVHPGTGQVAWTPGVLGPVSVLLRATNAHGSAQQAFVLGRAAGAPSIVRSANLHAAVGAPYLYDEDGVVDLAGVKPEERFVLARVAGPEALRVDATTRAIGWLPTAVGSADITLALQLPDGSAVDTYSFTTQVIDVSHSDIVAAVSAAPEQGLAPLTVTLDGSASRGTDGVPIISHAWDLADGALVVGAAASVQHTYGRAGGYRVSLLVRDQLGFGAEAGVQVLVATPDNVPPRARIVTTARTGPAPLVVALGCDCEDDDGSIVSVFWEFGDGNSSPEPETRYIFPDADTTYRVRLTVEDSGGLLSYDSVEVVTTGRALQPPRARILASAVDGAAPLTVALVADVSDPDGVVVGYTWTFPDGSSRHERSTTWELAAAGEQTVRLAVVDNDGLTAYDARTVLVRNARDRRPPRIISLPSTTVRAGEPYSYDADGLPSAQGDRPLWWGLGKVVGAEVVNAPLGMTFDNSTGRLSWTPGADQVGTHRVTLGAFNDAGATLQDFDLVVSAGAGPAAVPSSGCGCGAAGGSGWAVLLLGVCVRRHRRGDLSC